MLATQDPNPAHSNHGLTELIAKRVLVISIFCDENLSPGIDYQSRVRGENALTLQQILEVGVVEYVWSSWVEGDFCSWVYG